MFRLPLPAALAALTVSLSPGCGSGPAPTATAATPAAPAVVTSAAPEHTAAAPEHTPATPIADQYRDAAGRIIATALAGDRGWNKLEYLTDRIGHRLSGSPSLERAVQWAAEAMRADGHENVRLEQVTVPHWVRGTESAWVESPARHKLAILGLGGTVGTPRRGITAQVVTARTFEELESIGDAVKGKIVLFTHAMPKYSHEHGSGYGTATAFRWNGASAAAKLGAKAVLIRSLTAHSLSTPHTGSMGYKQNTPRIPAAAVSIEGAELIDRLIRRGQDVRVTLKLGARTLPDTTSHNVIGELVGSERPEEVVVIGGHIDSWDVGQGAHDDATGCVISMEALSVLRELKLRPRRTIRVVLWTNEENGLGGARAYGERYGAVLDKHIAGIESDSGGFAPQGFHVQAEGQALAEAADIVSLLGTIGANRSRKGHSGADLGPLIKAGVPTLGLWVAGDKYFNYHHTDADTLDKVDPEQFKRGIASMAVMAFVLADMPEPFGGKRAAAVPVK